MALRSGLVTETIWAINVINILLYDDSAPLQSFNLNNIPELLNLIVEHFFSCLTILYPKYFKVKKIICFKLKFFSLKIIKELKALYLIQFRKRR